MNLCFFSLFFFAFGWGSLWAETSWQGTLSGGFSAKIQLSAVEISLADPLKVQLDVAYPSNYTIDPEAIKMQLLVGFHDRDRQFTLVSERIKTGKEHSQGPQKIVTQSLTYILEPLVPGTFSLSFLNIFFLPNSSKDKPKELFTDIFEVKVLPLSIEKANALTPANPLNFSLRPPIEMDQVNRASLFDNPKAAAFIAQNNEVVFRERVFPVKKFALVIFAIVLVCLVSFLFQRYFLSWWHRPLDPRSKALRNLKAVRREKVETDRGMRAFYIRLIDTIRCYIEEEYHVRACHYTTEEFLQAIVGGLGEFGESEKRLLGHFLEQADLVKFADRYPTKVECEGVERAAEELIAFRREKIR